MPRRPQNRLDSRALPGGSLQLFGYVLGQRIRERFSGEDAALDLEARKRELLRKLEHVSRRQAMVATRLTTDQLEDAEAAVLRAQGRFTLLQAVIAYEGRPLDVVPIKPEVALKSWLHHLETAMKRYPRTLKNNKGLITSLLKACPVAYLHEITPEMVSKRVLRVNLKGQSQIRDGSIIGAFGEYCRKEGWLRENFMQVDLDKIRRDGRRPRILSPEQLGAFLQAAVDSPGARLVPFVVLSTWCFLRPEEATRVVDEDIDLTPGHARVHIDPRKAGTPRYRFVEIPENARLVLQWCREKELLKKGERVFFERREFAAVREAAGLIKRAEKYSKGGYRKIVETVWQDHICRHSGLTYFYQVTGDIRETCRQAGNSSDTAFRNYIELPKVPGVAERFYDFLPKVDGVNFDLAGARAEAQRLAASRGGSKLTPAKREQLKAALAKRWTHQAPPTTGS